MDNMTLTYMNKCIYVFFSKIYQKFSKISAVGLVIISAIFCLMRNGSGTRQIGFCLSRGKRQLRIFASKNKTAWEFCVMWINDNICIKLSMLFLCPRHSKNGGGALSVTPVRAFVRAFSVRASVRPLSKFGVRSITFERLHRFNSNLVCWYIISKHRSSSIGVTIYLFLTELWAFYKNVAQILVSAQ